MSPAPDQLRADDRPCECPAIIAARVRILSTASTRERKIADTIGRVKTLEDDGMIEIEAEDADRSRHWVHRSQLMRITSR